MKIQRLCSKRKAYLIKFFILFLPFIYFQWGSLTGVCFVLFIFGSHFALALFSSDSDFLKASITTPRYKSYKEPFHTHMGTGSRVGRYIIFGC